MNLLAGKLYDPSTAVNKVTTAALALTALDTTNLRLAFVVPPSGIVRVRMGGVLHGATTFPQIVLGVLEGSTVRGRQAPMSGGGNLAATTLQRVEADFLVTGLTPGASLNWDAAYGVETLVAATGLKYGGPNNATANDNFGGFAFEIWDVAPIYTPTSGTAPTIPVSTRIDTIDDFVDTEVAAIKAKTDNLPPDPADASDLLAAVAAIQADTDNIQTRLPAALVGGRMASNAEVVGDKSGYSLATAPLDAAGTRAALGLAAANLDAQLAALFPTSGYTAPDNAGIAAIKVQTDKLTFTAPGFLDVNTLKMNGATVNGDGTAGNLWRGA